MTILVQPPTTAQDGVNFPTNGAPVVQVKDAQGNNIAGQQVVVSIFSGNGTLRWNNDPDHECIGPGNLRRPEHHRHRRHLHAEVHRWCRHGYVDDIRLVVGAPQSINVNAGAGQSVSVGELAPVAPSAIVHDIGGNPVPSASVLFTTSPAGSQIQNSNTCCNNLTVTTNAAGIASLVSWRLASSVQKDTVTASVNGHSVFFIATGVAQNGNILVFASRTTTPPAECQQ